MFTRAIDRATCEEIADGAVLQEDGVILETGTYEDFARRFPTTPVLGSGNEVMLPGFVNAHHHIGLTPVQLGSPDMPLELWFATRIVTRNVDLYLDTLYSAFEMIASGITTVQHIHGGGGLPGGLAEVEARSDQVLRAYQDVGMRVSYCFGVRDQNRLVYQADADFVAGLPEELKDVTAAWFARSQLVVEDQLQLVRAQPAGGRGSAAAVQEPLVQTQGQRAHQDPAGAGQSALVFGCGLDGAGRDLAGL